MGIEYYLVKPLKKEIFYLGKHFSGFSEIPSIEYKPSLESADFPNYEDWDDFFWNTLRENWEYFLSCDLTLEQASDIIHEIYEWCASDKVIFEHDCSPTAHIWAEWKETGSIVTLLEEAHSLPCTDNSDLIQNYLEECQSIIFENPSYNKSIVGVTTDGRAVYDYARMIQELSKEDNMTYENAEEFIQYNTLGVLPQADEKYPVIIHYGDTL